MVTNPPQKTNGRLAAHFELEYAQRCMIDFRFWVDLIGWAGALAVLLAYALISARKLKGDSRAFQLLNLAGGVFLLINTVYFGALPSAFVNLVWIGIAVVALVRIASQRKDGLA